MQTQHDVFLSYSSKDLEFAKVLVDALEMHGISVWWDQTISPGETWDERIAGALASARCVVVLWSRQSVSSRWVRDEAGRAASGDRLVPVLIDDVDIPVGFGRIEAAKLVAWQGEIDHPEFLLLLRAVRKFVETPPGDALASTPTRAPIFTIAVGVVIAGIALVALPNRFVPEQFASLGSRVAQVSALGVLSSWIFGAALMERMRIFATGTIAAGVVLTLIQMTWVVPVKTAGDDDGAPARRFLIGYSLSDAGRRIVGELEARDLGTSEQILRAGSDRIPSLYGSSYVVVFVAYGSAAGGLVLFGTLLTGALETGRRGRNRGKQRQ